MTKKHENYPACKEFYKRAHRFRILSYLAFIISFMIWSHYISIKKDTLWIFHEVYLYSSGVEDIGKC